MSQELERELESELDFFGCFLSLSLFSRCFHELKFVFWTPFAASYFLAPPSVTASCYQSAEEEGCLLLL